MQTVSEDFFCSVSVHCILREDRSSCKAEHLRIIKELHYPFVTIPEVASVALIEYHDNAGMTYSFYLVAVPCLADGGIEFLDSGNDNLGITVQTLYKFVRIIRSVHRTRLESLIFRLGLCIEVVTVNDKHHLVHIVQFRNELGCLK